MPVTPTVLDSGSQTTTVGTLHVLGGPTRTVAGIFVLRADVSTMLAGDHLAWYCAEEIQNNSATARDVIIGELAGSQGENDWWHSSPMLLANGWDFKVRHAVGVSLVMTWSIWQL